MQHIFSYSHFIIPFVQNKFPVCNVPHQRISESTNQLILSSSNPHFLLCVKATSNINTNPSTDPLAI